MPDKPLRHWMALPPCPYCALWGMYKRFLWTYGWEGPMAFCDRCGRSPEAAKQDAEATKESVEALVELENFKKSQLVPPDEIPW